MDLEFYVLGKAGRGLGKGRSRWIIFLDENPVLEKSAREIVSRSTRK